MKEVKISVLVVSTMLIVGLISGYLVFPVNAEDGDEVVLSHEYVEGDFWSYTSVEEGEDFGEMTMNFTVEDEDSTYEDHDVNELSLEMSVGDFESEEGIEFRNWTGTGMTYENDIEYMDYEMSYELLLEEAEDWIDFRIEIEQEMTTNVSYPDEAEIGDTFSVERTMESNETTYMEGEKVEEEQTTETEQRHYEIEGKETVEVEAGEFESVVVTWTNEDGEEGEIYYSSEVKRLVRQVTYDEEDEIDSEIELQEYDVEEDDEYDLTFIIETVDGDLIEGATIEIDGMEETTDPNGEAVFEDIEPDTYDWEVTHDDYESEDGDVEIVDQDKTVTVAMEEEEDDIPGFTTLTLVLGVMIAVALYRKKKKR